MNSLNKKTNQQNLENDFKTFHNTYIDMISFIERLHRLMLDVIKDELDKQDINNISAIQALLLFNIGPAELTAGELKTRGYYLGSNVSYNLKKLVEMKFVSYEKSHIDRRSIRIKLTESGRRISKIVSNLYAKHTYEMINKDIMNIDSLENICVMHKNIEKFWNNTLRNTNE